MHVLNLASNGLTKHWGDKYRDEKYKKIQRHRVPEKLTLPQLIGIFYVCAVLYSLSFLVFVVEIILWNIRHRHRFSIDENIRTIQ